MGSEFRGVLGMALGQGCQPEQVHASIGSGEQRVHHPQEEDDHARPHHEGFEVLLRHQRCNWFQSNHCLQHG